MKKIILAAALAAATLAHADPFITCGPLDPNATHFCVQTVPITATMTPTQILTALNAAPESTFPVWLDPALNRKRCRYDIAGLPSGLHAIHMSAIAQSTPTVAGYKTPKSSPPFSFSKLAEGAPPDSLAVSP